MVTPVNGTAKATLQYLSEGRPALLPEHGLFDVNPYKEGEQLLACIYGCKGRLPGPLQTASGNKLDNYLGKGDTVGCVMMSCFRVHFVSMAAARLPSVLNITTCYYDTPTKTTRVSVCQLVIDRITAGITNLCCPSFICMLSAHCTVLTVSTTAPCSALVYMYNG